MVGMAKSKKSPDRPIDKQPDVESPSNPDRHKPSKMVRVRMQFAKQLEKMVAKNVSDFTEEANIAIREYLERHGFWPPKGDK
jgi:hypothetical protein